jgi:beta-lactam-binding protein with PASTA domain
VKFRRRFATPGRLKEFLSALRHRLGIARHSAAPSATDAQTPAAPEQEQEAEAEIVQRTARPRPEQIPSLDELLSAQAPTASGEEPGAAGWLSRWRWPVRHRQTLEAAGVLAGTLLLGYLLAALVLFPAPIFASHRSVPRVLGMDEVKARDALTAAGFGIGAVQREPHPTAPAGTVVWQDPPAEVVAPEATDVALTLSSGPQRIPVPDVAGYDAEIARSLIEGAGLRVGSVESTQAPTPQNVAVNTRPPAGTTLNPGTDIVLVVSVGAATIRVPTLLGLSADEARLALETAGLALGTTFPQTTTAVAPGEVFYQDPPAGTLSAPGTVVNVRIARSPR